MNIGDKLRQIRKNQRIRQQTIAEVIGVAVDTYRRWEGGKHSIKAEKLKRLSEVLNVPIGELLAE